MQPLLSAVVPATRYHIPAGTATAPLPIAAGQGQHCHGPSPLSIPTSFSLQSSLPTAPQPARGRQDPPPSNLQGTSSQPAVPATALHPE